MENDLVVTFFLIFVILFFGIFNSKKMGFEAEKVPTENGRTFSDADSDFSLLTIRKPLKSASTDQPEKIASFSSYETLDPKGCLLSDLERINLSDKLFSHRTWRSAIKRP